MCHLDTFRVSLLMVTWQVFTRALVANDWERFDYYAYRVRALRGIIPDWSYNPIAPSVFEALRLSRHILQRSSPLLKRLRGLRWEGDHSFLPSLSNISLFVGPLITMMYLEFIPNIQAGIEASTALKVIRAGCPRLEYLQITHEQNTTPTFRADLSDLLRNMTFLRDLQCIGFSLPPEAFGHIASKTPLRALQCSIDEDVNYIRNVVSFLPSEAFQKLKDLALTCGGLSDATFLLGALDNLIIQSIEITAYEPPSSLNLHDFFSVVARRFIRAGVTDVSISNEERNFNDQIDFDGPMEKLDTYAIEPLFALPNLQKLDISTHSSIELVNDLLIRDMVSAWSHLRYLRIVPLWPWHEEQSSITFEGFAHLTACRELEMLELCLNTSSWSISKLQEQPDRTSCKSLDHLGVEFSTIHDSQVVATILLGLFPNITTLAAWDRYDRSDDFEARQHAMWEEVEVLMNIKNERASSDS